MKKLLNKMTKKTMALSLICIFNTPAFALTDDEVVCNRLLDKSAPEKALQQADKILKTKTDHAAAFICQGRAYYMLDKSDEALKAFNSAENATKDFYDQAVAIIMAGNVYKKLQKYPEAIEQFERAFKTAEKAKNKQLMLTAYLSIGDIQYQNQQVRPALEAYQKAMTYAMNDNERGETLEKIAASHAQLKQYDLALEQQLKSYLMMERAGTLDQFATSSVTLGRYYFLNKNFTAAEKTLNKIIQFAKDNGGAFYEAQGSYVLAQVKAAQNEMDAAKKLVAHAKKIAQDTQDKSLEAEIDRETANI